MAFELMETDRRRLDLKPKLTIKKNGSISFNRASTELVTGKHVEVYFDEKENLVGFKFLEKKTEQSCKMSEAGSISAKTKLNGKITHTISKTYDVVSSNGMLVVDMKAGVPARTRQKKEA